jgi:lysophospholipase L1-like esterase
MKFCYADFSANTNVDSLFSSYQTAFNNLQTRFPHVRFVHVTAPLYNQEASWHNSIREQFNARLRATYGERVFDLATMESLRPNGTTALSRDNTTIALADEWTSDGGHLNTAGENRFGGALVAFLAAQ